MSNKKGKSPVMAGEVQATRLRFDANLRRVTSHASSGCASLARSWAHASRVGAVITALSISCAFAQEDPPPPPPAPSRDSVLGAAVTNPVTNLSTTVSALIKDPAGTPTADDTAFVKTADGYVFLVKDEGETIYNADLVDDEGDPLPPLGFIIVSVNETDHTVELRGVDPDWPADETHTLGTRLLESEFDIAFTGDTTDPTIFPDIELIGDDGVTRVLPGASGGNGHAGALFVPPGTGRAGSTGPTVIYPAPADPATITSMNRTGIEIGSIGGRGGNGGSSYGSFWSGRDGGSGGAGGTVIVTNGTNVTVNTTANAGNTHLDRHGIFAFSRSGEAGDGGTGYAAPGGGQGGHASDGGSATVTNNANVFTTGPGGFGIFGSSISGNGGQGGGQWGIVGKPGRGGYGGSGGPVSVTNNGLVQTGGATSIEQLGNGTGILSHGIVAQSIGGAGGSSGAGGNLIVSLPASGDDGGSGGAVSVTNNGTVTTTAAQSRGIFAQSVGGGGGSGASTGGLIAIGGAGANGGNAGIATVINGANGSINTYGVQSDAIFAQSVGGSGGGGSPSGGLFAVGGNGSNAGNGEAVTVENHGSISTARERSRGIVAQSIGGGGGDGGSSSGLASVGGSGDGGGLGRTIRISNSGSIATEGKDSIGIYAQSIGGGGGNGGNSGGVVAVGGSAAQGGDSSTVTIEHSGSITTEGTDSTAIFAQAIGGGGGNGGSAGSFGVFAGAAIGGAGGKGGLGGDVDITLQGKDANTASRIATGTDPLKASDRSAGIFAQSVGGGGGNGGGSVQVSQGFGPIGLSASMSIGGSGGEGGGGGKVTLQPGDGGVSIVETGGNDSTGVFLQSVGGGGGNGGYAVSVAASGGLISGSLSVAVGGTGGDGGGGGIVEVGDFDADGKLLSSGFNGSVHTKGERSAGFIAQSVGGGGGNGGLAVSVAGSASAGISGSIAVGVGGTGGDGGLGGDVAVGTSGNITTEKAHSTGMLVQSVGGGGGNGGGTIGASIAASGGGAGAISVGVGGNAGAGNSGGDVTVATRAGTITTKAESSSGLIVQSVGGGGGNGGYSIAAGAAIAGIGAGAVNVGLGGKGGTGAIGGEVKADLQSNVTTSGENSTAVLVQSVGGGGGNGGFSIAAGGSGAGVGSGAVSVGLGGSGGAGGSGGEVNASSSGQITTTKDRSSGLVVQSVGGGGGNGGFNISGTLSGGGVGAGAVSVGLGGAGGGGGIGKSVVASSSGDVTTKGDMSTGILAQSVGGGGGNGGFNVSVALSAAGVGSGAIGVGLGGSGATGANASSVDLQVNNDVTTEGGNSAAVIAQSIGGGGGNGGFNVTVAGSGAGVGSGAVGVGLGGSAAGGGNGGNVTSVMTGDIVTKGSFVMQDGARIEKENSAGLIVQSVGGGGGNGGFNVTAAISAAGTGSGGVSVGLGGSGGGGGTGGDVDSKLSGDVTTNGNLASGVTVQSLGGGGGNGGFNVTGAITAAGSGSGGVAVGIGGSGGAGGLARTVKSEVTGDVITRGNQSGGVIAQSLGGGGGNGGFNVSGVITAAGSGSGGVAVGIGGAGGDGGAADTVTSTVTGDVQTSGHQSSGIVAQSLGGGGGNGGVNVSGTVSIAGTGSGAVSVGIGGSGGKGGGSGVVTSTVTGDVTTTGNESSGVVAQSLGGGGGNGGLNVSGAINASGSVGGAVAVGIGGSGGGGGDSSTVDATITGDVSTTGRGAAAIVAQSLAGGGGNGGLNVGAAVNLSGKEGGAVSVGIGGSGGDGGDAQRAAVSVTGDVRTQGASDAGGVLAQSLGGGGGNGGLNVAAGISLTGNTGGAVAVGVGGSGGDGGIGREARATVTGDVGTLGAKSNAITAQSIGGGGGAGGLNVTGSIAASLAGAGNVGVGIGGAGGGGGAAGLAVATVTGVATTLGNDSHGVLVQSVGGGGGSGGLNVTGGITAAKSGAGTLAVGVGGFGGDGGGAGAVQGTVTGGAHTSGDQSYGVLMQSLGGGGGAGGLNVAGGISLSKETSGTAGIGIGGFGGKGGVGSTVTGHVTGAVSTSGAKSTGVLAQSVGGGGGNGGLNVTGIVQLTTDGAAAAAVGVGGFGGDGGVSDVVTLTRTGNTVTTGARSDGVVAQSIGGGGGNGGLNVSGAISGTSKGSAFSASIGVGGFGGKGGQAGAVNATVTGDVRATGVESDRFELQEGVMRRVRAGGSNGVLAQSVGGGGGNGGLNVSGGIALAKPKSGSNALNIGLGGFGGEGGNAGAVTLNVDANTVSAVGDERFAVGAQSVGGGGGNGGINVSGGVVMDGQLTLGIGGFGGKGGTGAAVNATADTNIAASGKGAIGFMAQSVGGGGGNGALNVSGGIQTSTSTEKPSLIFGLGGGGGAGNVSGNVTATQRGAIDVEGADSIGVLAQSIAGGGGNGGLNVSGAVAAGKGYSAAIGVGGFAGDGANAGTVTLTSDGEIVVDGREPIDPNSASPQEDRAKLNFRERANGILAQSIGGGGGNGGMNVTGVLTNKGSPVAVGVGGYGGGGGNAGAVRVTRGLSEASVIATRGAEANGLTAQSIGGGGGNAGANLVVEFSKGEGEQSKNKQVLITVGGDGGEPGHGEKVDVTHVGNILTEGRQSDGILAQSVGGGGGTVGVNLGGGFGRSKSDMNIAVGGAPGDGGEGRAVTVNHRGAITTLGEDATAIFAQSVGGGGGDAEADDSQFADYLTAPEVVFNALSKEENSIDITLGRTGGTGGKGGIVSVTSEGALKTVGDRSVGIRAQSVGNGGGVSGSTSVAYSGKNNLDIQVGLEGGEGGRADAVSVQGSGSIDTEGAQAHAIHAQSVGGGGGVGGAVTSTLVPSDNSLAVDLGGTGGTGGVAGAVNVNNSATLVTRGESAHGIHAQSIGGGGGDGGFAGASVSDIAQAATDALVEHFSKKEEEGDGSSTTISAVIGGTGGTGAKGSTVVVGNAGFVATEGRTAHGISAQSIGGGGGDGGMVLNGFIAGGKSSKSLTIAVGGTGGDAGTADDVTVLNQGTLYTRGDESMGIRATSIGGGGGDAGLLANLSVAAFQKDSTTTAVSVNVGGSGGTGATAGDVSVTNRRDASGGGGIILTEGSAAHGIFAQSLGGGGGNGSSIVSANFAGGQNTTQVGVSIGGTGGEGGAAGTVTVTNAAQIETLGDKSHGVFAQSIGGGGGNGGLVLAANAAFAASRAPLVTLGGAGGDGNDASSVTVNNTGSIVTRGANANGIFAQSIGGGGGNAGIGVGLASDNVSTNIAGALSILFGGRGGEGGEGGHVTVNHSGDITVLGDNSRAVVAESINGGGGHVALDFNGITSLPGGSALPGEPVGTQTDPVFVFNGGGNEVQSSNAGRVTLNYTGTFGAAGSNGAANTVQAIGGGGGTLDLDLDIVDAQTAADDRVRIEGRLGGASGSDNSGGEIQSMHTGNLATAGDNTLGLFVQSIGGGGGRASIDASSQTGALGASTLAVGGTNGTNENGGNIEHVQSGSIATSGESAHGAVMQSIGGGGGALSLRVQESAAGSSIGSNKKTRLQATAVDAPLALKLGGLGGSGVDGGAIELALSGDVSTTGASAAGLILQSVGGGGGLATTSASQVDVTLGGSAGANGNGGDIEVVNTGEISTQGARAHGVLLQSIGGGGGALLSTSATPTATLSAGNRGDGGAIQFRQVGNIVTSGNETYGLLAQSLGGGGGLVDGMLVGSAGGVGSGGTIELNIEGNIVTQGDGSTAVFAQSAGGQGGADIDVNINGDHRVVGGTNGIAVALDGGAANSLSNAGSIMTMSGASGRAIVGGAGGETILNHGTVFGNVDLGSGANRFSNRANAKLYSGATMNLGSSDHLLTNDGRLAPGSAGLAVVTHLNGGLVQSSGGTSTFELDLASGVMDSIIATGAVVLDGALDVALLNTYAIKPGRQQEVVYSGAGGVVDQGLQLQAQRSVVIDYELIFENALAVLNYNVDFSPADLLGNRVRIGDYINEVQKAGGSPALADTITALVAQTDLGAYSHLLTQLGPEFYAEQLAYTLGSAQHLGRVLQDCGPYSLGRVWSAEQGCMWARLDIDASTRDRERGFPSIEQTARRYSQGYQRRSANGWTYGLGLDVEDSSSHGFGSNWRADAAALQVGGLLRRSFDRTSVGAVVGLGYSNQDVRRQLFVTGRAQAVGQRDVTFATGVFDVAHHLTINGFTITPALNVGFAALHGGGLTESDAGAQGLRISGGTESHAWIEPTIAFGVEQNWASRRVLRAYARVGALHYLTDGSTKVSAGFLGAPSDVATMRVTSDLGLTRFTAEAGIELVAIDRFSVGLAYGLEHSSIRESGSGAIRITIPVVAR